MVEFAEELYKLESLRIEYAKICEIQSKILEFEKSFEKVKDRQGLLNKKFMILMLNFWILNELLLFFQLMGAY